MLNTTKEATVINPGAGAKMSVMGHAVAQKLTGQETSGDYYVFEVTSPPGTGIPPHVHRNEDEIIYVVEGNYTIFLGGQMWEAPAGALLHFPCGVPHGFQNTGDTPGRTLWMVTPGAGFEKFFAELGALPADQPPDMAKVVEIFQRYDIEILPPSADNI